MNAGELGKGHIGQVITLECANGPRTITLAAIQHEDGVVYLWPTKDRKPLMATESDHITITKGTRP